jgi:hypothetical protein
MMRHKNTSIVLVALSVLVAPSFSSQELGVGSQLVAQTSRRRSKKPVDRDAALEAALRKRTQKIQAKYCRDLERTIVWATKTGLKKDSAALLRQIRSINPDYKKLDSLEKRIEKAEELEDADKIKTAKKSLVRRLATANKKQGKDLASLSTACMRVGLFTKAFDMISNVIEISPDDAKARKILGFKKDRKTKTWITNWEYEKRKKHFLTPEGWIEKKHKKDFEKGLRPYKGKWIPKERERQIRTRNEFGAYTVVTEHFEVKTNLGREKAYQFATRLENFYNQFFRVFIGYYDQVAGAKLLFNRPDVKKQHVVILFPTRAEYLIHVKQEMGNDPLLRDSGGFYSPSIRKSRFYWNDNVEETYRTLHHEVAHQLFAETKKTSRGGSQGNNWVVEGIASYIETWKVIDGRWLPGYEIENRRLQHTKSFLDDNDDWTLGDFAKIGNKQFHKENRGLNYAISGSLCHFFMHYDDERYKEDFVRFLSAYYEGKVSESSLVSYIKVEGDGGVFATLDKQFRAYMSDLKRPTYNDFSEDDEATAAAG